MKLKKRNFLVLAGIMFFILGSITILSNNFKTKDNTIAEKDNGKLVENKYKSNLVVESDDNNIVVTNEETEEDGGVRIFPDDENKEIIILPKPNTDEQVILKKL